MGMLGAIARAVLRIGKNIGDWLIYVVNKYLFRTKWDKADRHIQRISYVLNNAGGKLNSKGSGKVYVKIYRSLEKYVKSQYFFGAVDRLAKFVWDSFCTLAKIQMMDYVLVDWYNKYLQHASEGKINGALNADASFENLRWLLTELIILEQLSGGNSEVAEFFTEGISNAISEILEKQLIGALTIQTNLRYGSRELDPDSIGEAVEARFVESKWHDYEALLSGSYNSTAGYIIAKGRRRTLEEMTQVIHQDIFYNIMKAYEGYQATADIFLDEARALYKDRLYNGKDEVEKGLNRWLTQLLNTISYVDSLIDDIGEMTDEEWDMIKPATKRNYNRTLARNVAKLNFLYEFLVKPSAEQWDNNVSIAQDEFNNFIQKHDEMRKEMCDILVGKEQYIYDIVVGSITDSIKNIQSMRSSGGFSVDNDRFKNKL